MSSGARKAEAAAAARGRPSFRADPVRDVRGRIAVPGDKSISHRALMLGAVAEGTTRIRGFLEGEDCIATRRALEALGVPIADEGPGALRVSGVGPSGLAAPSHALDLGNSGTAMRLLTGLLAAQPFDSELTGDDSLRRRPMERVAAPLRAMGARIETRDGKAPIRIRGGARLHGIEYALPVASAQVKSALLLAGLYARGRTVLRSPGPSRDHTERMVRSLGADLDVADGGLTVALEGPQTLRAAGHIEVPGDFSSAAFFIVAGCLGAKDGLTIEHVGVNPTRTGLLEILEAMGAEIELRNPRSAGAEPIADLHVKAVALRGIEVPPELVPLAIDEFPILFIAAAAAQGKTVVRGAEELRHKESDRIAVMAQGLRALGIGVEERPDGLVIEGGRFRGGTVDSRGDHRVAMAFAVGSLVSDGPIEILNTAEVATSFPEFTRVAAACGLEISVQEAA
ncbi:MAG TPA: 3-phosphoshikimate 1-carboxyvinyltransferase [Gammaproteobacteria bacterium]|nr:3-phosphoshikimate 1-carboxyvinyltransferase [Gammaproteobacteria bacterium]